MLLEVISSNKFVGFADGNILSWCPKMDLLAVSMNKTSIWVFRLNGDRVYSINNKSAILDLRWNHSGKYFVVSGTDSMLKVYDANNGRLINQLPTSDNLPITLTSWSFIDVKRSIGDDENHSAMFDEMFKWDILKSLPKLSNEVSVTESSQMSQSESVINTQEDDNLLDCLLFVNANALLSITFNNLFTVSDIELPAGKYLKHASPENLFSQFFLVENETGNLQVREMKMEVGDCLKRKHLLETIDWCSQIVSLVNHINEQIKSVISQAGAFIKILDRHLGNLKDTLYEEVDLTKEFPTPEQVEEKLKVALMDLLVTGLIPESQKSFWVDQFGERGMTRVSSLGNSAYDTARKTMFSQVVLATEKLIILLSNLESVAQTEHNHRLDTMGMSIESIATAIKQAQDLIKQVYAFIFAINDEQDGMNRFLNWCKVEILEKLASESDPEQFLSAHPNIQFRATPIMDYFEERLLHSVFFEYFDMEDDETEVIKSSQSDILTINANIDALHKELTDHLMAGMQQYITGKVKFMDPLDLEIDANQTSSDIQIAQSSIYVTGVKGRKLSTVKVSNSTQEKSEINFTGDIISHEMLGTNHILVLCENPPYSKLTLVTMTEKDTFSTQNLEFTESTSVQKPELLAINGVGDPEHIIGCVLDRVKKENLVFKVTV